MGGDPMLESLEFSIKDTSPKVTPEATSAASPLSTTVAAAACSVVVKCFPDADGGVMRSNSAADDRGDDEEGEDREMMSGTGRGT